MMLRVAFEEAIPEAPLLVLPNGASLPKQVAALKREGFAGAVALHDALGVAAAGGGADADAGDAGGGDAAGEDADGGGAQGEMVRQRAALADAFARREDVPLLVTTELAARADRLEKYMQQHRVPLHLRRRVNAFVDALQKAKGDSSAAIANTAPS